jgi:hypothetical protein
MRRLFFFIRYIGGSRLQTVSSIFGVNYEWLKTGKGYMFVSGEEKSDVDKEKMGERIKIVRKRSGLTQEEFADRICHPAVHLRKTSVKAV